MTSFVELWLYLSATPLFGLTATLGVYVLAHAAYTRLGQASATTAGPSSTWMNCAPEK